MQNLIFWFFNRYGFYFYIEKFKLINNKILLQFYFYKTYLYSKKYHKKKIYRILGFTNLGYRTPLLRDARQFNLNKVYSILNKTFVKKKTKQRYKHLNKPYKRSINRNRFMKKSIKLPQKILLRNVLQKINIFYLIKNLNKIPNSLVKAIVSSLSYNIFYKLFLYFKNNCQFHKQYIFLYTNYKYFLLMKKLKKNKKSDINNHTYKYIYFAIANPKIPENKFFRKYILRDMENLRKIKKAQALATILQSTPSPKVTKVLKTKRPFKARFRKSYNQQSNNKRRRIFKPFFKKRYVKKKNIPISSKILIKYKQLQRMKQSLTFNFFFTYYFAFFFHCQTHLLYKSLYKYMFAHATLRQEYNILSQRSKYLRRRNRWAFDFLFFLHYSVTFANTLFLWPFLVYHLKRTFKRHATTMRLIINVLRTIFFLKPYFKGFKMMIKGPYDRHGRSRKLLLQLGHMGFTEYMHHPIIYDMIHCPIVYGMCSIKFWMAYE